MNTALRYSPVRLRSLLGIVALAAMASGACADEHDIENLAFFDRSPDSPRADSFEPVLRQDANDSSFASLAGWLGGYDTWQKQFEHTKNLVAATPNAGLVFLGDSLTQNWGNVGGRRVRGCGVAAWNSAVHDYRQYNALNLGIAGDQTQNILYRIQHGQLDGLSPGLVVLMVGTNNLFAPQGNPGFPAADYVGPAHTPAEVADGILATVQAIHAKLPEAQILTLGVLRGHDSADPDRQAADQVNALLAKAFGADDNPRLHYLDFTPAFRGADGKASAAMAGDAIHLTTHGYELWAEAIAPFVRQYATPAPTPPALNVAPRGQARWGGSVDGLYNHHAAEAIDDDVETICHSDFQGDDGGDAAVPDVLTVTLDRPHDLTRIEIVNRGGVDGGSPTSDQRLTGTLVEVLDAAARVLAHCTLEDDPAVLGETHVLDGGGRGFASARTIRLTAENYLHVSEVRAFATSVPVPAGMPSAGLGSRGPRLPSRGPNSQN